MKDERKTIGIIGGMGPLATADLFEKIIRVTDAKCDQEHLHVIIDSNTLIPDRTAAILHGGEDPLPQLTASAKRLRSAGAELLIMPCNTAHYFHAPLQATVDIPILHMLNETASALRRKGISRIGLLATDGTVSSGVYAKAFSQSGVEMLLPDAQGQSEVMRLIYDGIKAGRDDLDISGFLLCCDRLLKAGAESLVLGCTELPPAFDIYHIDLPHTDPTAVLAAAAVRFAGGRLKPEADPL